MSYEYTLYVHLISFSHDVILPWNGYTIDVSFINVTKCVKLCLKVNLHILAARLVGAYLTSLNIFFSLQMNCSSSMYMSTKAAVEYS